MRRHVDVVLAAGLGLLYVLEMAFEADVEHRPASIAVALGFCATLVIRARVPFAGLAAGLVVIELDNTLLHGLAEAGAFLVGFVLALYSAGRHARGAQAAATVIVMLVAIPLAAIEPGKPVGFTDFAFFTIFFAGPWAVGRLIRYRREREDVSAQEAVAGERVRIARELHDVVAHGISVMVLQARGGRRMLDESPAETREALDAIERAGEQALVEMRRLLQILRAGDGPELAPQPSLTHLDELVAGLVETGLPVDVRVEGTPIDLPPGIDVTAYRIVQEALTNALKHAGPAHVYVNVRYAPSAVELEVLDDGPGVTDTSGSGHGLVGLRERVAVYGGSFESGRQPGGGFALRAWLPLDEAT